MSRARVAAIAMFLLAGIVPADPAAAGVAGIRVATEPTSVATSIGRKFVLRTTIFNGGAKPVPNLVAHLNVLSLDGSVYVDPEDWSSHRTRFLAPVAAGGSVTLNWQLQAVNAGSIGVYVAVLPRSGVAQPPTTGPTIHVTIARRQTLNSGGILPLALGVPAFLMLLAVGARFRRPRRRTARAS